MVEIEVFSNCIRVYWFCLNAGYDRRSTEFMCWLKAPGLSFSVRKCLLVRYGD